VLSPAFRLYSLSGSSSASGSRELTPMLPLSLPAGSRSQNVAFRRLYPAVRPDGWFPDRQVFAVAQYRPQPADRPNQPHRAGAGECRGLAAVPLGPGRRSQPASRLTGRIRPKNDRINFQLQLPQHLHCAQSQIWCILSSPPDRPDAVQRKSRPSLAHGAVGRSTRVLFSRL